MEGNAQTIDRVQLTKIIKAVENVFGRTPKTPKDFDLLRQSVYERTSTLLSTSTLKRLWGYLKEKANPRQSTLEILCRYAGWTDLDAAERGSGSPESGPLAMERINIEESGIKTGEKICISWLPDRMIQVEYLGEKHFKIVSALNTRLQTGDTFTAGIIAQNQPLYMDPLIRQGLDIGVYVCGRNSGIRFVIGDQKNQKEPI